MTGHSTHPEQNMHNFYFKDHIIFPHVDKQQNLDQIQSFLLRLNENSRARCPPLTPPITIWQPVWLAQHKLKSELVLTLCPHNCQVTADWLTASNKNLNQPSSL